ncbi:hypothetical protein D3C75_937020 [compost metagenome]
MTASPLHLLPVSISAHFIYLIFLHLDLPPAKTDRGGFAACWRDLHGEALACFIFPCFFSSSPHLSAYFLLPDLLCAPPFPCLIFSLLHLSRTRSSLCSIFPAPDLPSAPPFPWPDLLSASLFHCSIFSLLHLSRTLSFLCSTFPVTRSSLCSTFFVLNLLPALPFLCPIFTCLCSSALRNGFLLFGALNEGQPVGERLDN